MLQFTVKLAAVFMNKNYCIVYHINRVSLLQVAHVSQEYEAVFWKHTVRFGP